MAPGLATIFLWFLLDGSLIDVMASARLSEFGLIV
jgi:hypothetical protein